LPDCRNVFPDIAIDVRSLFDAPHPAYTAERPYRRDRASRDRRS
jgi:hypothetical protein